MFNRLPWRENLFRLTLSGDMDYKFSFIFETFNYKNADIHYMQSLGISDSILTDCI